MTAMILVISGDAVLLEGCQGEWRLLYSKFSPNCLFNQPNQGLPWKLLAFQGCRPRLKSFRLWVESSLSWQLKERRKVQPSRHSSLVPGRHKDAAYHRLGSLGCRLCAGGLLMSAFGVNGLPWWLRRWRICLQCRKPWFDPGVGKIHCKREWHPTSVCLEKSMDREAWWATVHGITKIQTQLSDSTARHAFTR